MQNDFMDFSEEAVTYEIADNGIYELQIENAELKKTETGKNFIALTYVIRNDVEQNYAGVKIWDNIWENEVHRNPQLNNKRIRKDDYDAMSQAQKQNIITRMEYDDYKIRVLVHSQDADKDSENYKTKFGNIEEVVLFLNGMCVQAKVQKYMDDKTGKERNSIDYKAMKRTSVPLTESSIEQVEVSEEDLPF